MPFPGSTDFKELVKSSINIVDYIGRDISLHKKNYDDYRGTVGTQGKTGESLIVTPSTQLWNDTKNGKGGDVFTWIAYNEGLDTDNDFPEILRIAADFAGLEMEGLTDEDRAFIEEGKDVTATLNEVTEIYYQNLLRNPEAIKQVKDDWNFGLDEIKAFKMGYATGEDLKHIENKKLAKAGLKYKNSNKELFVNRIMYPYLIRDNTVNFIGKKTPLTPTESDGGEGGKYKKLLTHDGTPDVSRHVNNKFLFGEDTIRKSDYVLIAEGISDAVSAIQRGYPTISAVTTHIKNSEVDRVSKIIGERPVKICLDIDNGGMKGAREMAEKLTLRGNEVSIITLTDSKGKKDFDLNDYFRTHTKEDFDELIENAVGYWNYILNSETPKECKRLPILTRLNKLKTFISNDLHQMPEDFWRAFVENDVLLAFGLNKKDSKAVIDACEKHRNELSADEEEEDKGEEIPTTDGKLPPLEDRLTAYPEHIKKKANEILDNGDPFKFICDTWNERHVGDRNLGEMLACSVASTQVLNLAVGIHEKPSGDTESGKSDACSKMGKLCPVWKFRATTFSPKVLYYMPNLLPGTIIYTDDVDLEKPDVISTIKKVTGEFEDPTISDTIIDGKAVTMVIPPRINFWMSSVDTIGDKQLGTRFIYSNTKGGAEHDREVNHKQRGKALGKPREDDNEKILVCRCMFEYICDQLHYVLSPYLFASTWSAESEKRNLEKFISVLFAVTVFKYRQRETLHDCLVGTLEDWERAITVYSHVAQNNSCLLSDEEIWILYSIYEMSEAYDDGVPHKRLLNYMKEKGRFSKSDSTLKRILIGDVGSGKQGFKEKVPGFSYETVSKPKLDDKGLEIKGSGYTKTLCYSYDGALFADIPKDADIVKTIKKGTFVVCDNYAAEGMEQLFREDPQKAHTLKKDTSTFENWKESLRNQRGSAEITRNHQNSKHLNSEKSIQQVTNNNNKNDNNKLRNHKTENKGGDEKNNSPFPQAMENNIYVSEQALKTVNSVNSVNSEPSASDQALISEPVKMISEPSGNESPINSDIVGLMRRALVKFAWDECKGIVPDIDEFTRKFNKKVPAYKEALGKDAVGYNANKLHMMGWK